MLKKIRWRWIFLGIFAIIILGGGYFYLQFRDQVNFAAGRGAGGVADITVPDGFEVTVFAEGLDRTRFIAFSPDGVLYAADRGSGRILALPDADGDGIADSIIVFAEDLNQPHSLIFHEGDWYIGIPSGVLKIMDSDGDGTADEVVTLIDDYPTNGHSTRTVAFLPDGRMVVSVGSSCNVCEENDERRAAVVIYDGPSATGESVFASGLRNAVGLAIHPQTGDLWASNNGRDLLGDDLPPETIYIVQDGKDYGWPRCHNGTIEDPDFGFTGSCEGVEPPFLNMQAHSAPLGIAFYTGTAFPAEYQGDLFVAFHGSWNRSDPTGYKIVRIPLDGSTLDGELIDFATGWLDAETEEVTGRPVGIAVGPDGALYVSDDKGGIIYRIQYVGD